MIVLDLSILNQKGTPMFNSDTFANRPTFGIVGRIFISTDTKEFYRDTGNSWELIGGPGSGTITGSGAATQIAFWNSASTITGSNNLWYDSTNSYLGVNTNAPGNPLDVHGNLSSVAALNQTTATNNTLLSLLNSGTPLWRIGNFYTAGANDFGIFDVVNTLQQLTIVKSTGQTFIGAKTTASGRLVVNSATADAHLQIVGANAPSIRIDNAGSGGTQRFAIGNATATNNFIQGSAAGDFCITTASAGPLLFGMWQTINASEVMRITTSNNLVIGSTFDGGQKLQVTGTAYISGNVGIGISAPLTYRASVYLNGAGIQNTLELNNIHQTIGVVDGVRLKIREFNVESSSTFGSTNNILTFGHSTNKQLTLTEAGNFGIGTTSPIYKLDVQGTSGTVAIRAASNTAGDILYYGTGSVTGSTDAFRTAINASGNVNLTLANNNTATGGSALEIIVPSASSGDPYLVFTTSGATNYTIGIDNSDSDKLKIGPVANPSVGADSIVLHTTGNTSFGSVVDNGNRLQVTGGAIITGGLGSIRVTTSGAEVFFSRDGNNDILANGGSSSALRIGANDALRFDTGATLTQRLTIKNNGIINFSNVPASSVGLVSGDIYQTAGVLNIVP